MIGMFLFYQQKNMSIHKLAIESAVAPSTIKNILYGKSQNPGIVTLKMLCDGFGITLVIGKNLVPSPAAGIIAFFILFILYTLNQLFRNFLINLVMFHTPNKSIP